MNISNYIRAASERKRILTLELKKISKVNEINENVMCIIDELYTLDPKCNETKQVLVNILLLCLDFNFLVKLLHFYPFNLDIVLLAGNTFKKMSNIGQALFYYRLASGLTDDLHIKSNVYYLISSLLFDSNQKHAAAIYAKMSLEENNTNSEAHNMLGVVYLQDGNIKESLVHFNLALNYCNEKNMKSNIHMNMGTALTTICKFEESKEMYQLSLQYNESNYLAFQNKLLDELYYETDEQIIFNNHLEINRYFNNVSVNTKKINKKRRIGIISGDLSFHPVSNFIQPLINRPETFVFSNGMCDEGIAKRENVFMINSSSDIEVDALIRKCDIDILLDLSVHTFKNRVSALINKPAPIIVNYLGYANSSGLKGIYDFRLVDHYSDGEGSLSTEKLLFFKNSFLCFNPKKQLEVDVKRIGKAGKVFISVNRIQKITNDVLRLWKRVLEETDGVIIIKNREIFCEENQERILSILPRQKVIFKGFEQNITDSYKLFNEVDFALDTYPYSGTCSTCDALAMGVPVITLEGTSHRQNVSKSILINSGMSHYVAKSEQEYINIAKCSVPNKMKIRNKFIKGYVCNESNWNSEFDELVKEMEL